MNNSYCGFLQIHLQRAEIVDEFILLHLKSKFQYDKSFDQYLRAEAF